MKFNDVQTRAILMAGVLFLLLSLFVIEAVATQGKWPTWPTPAGSPEPADAFINEVTAPATEASVNQAIMATFDDDLDSSAVRQSGQSTPHSMTDFTDIGADLTGVDLSSVAWGDYDNDGDLDILLTGIDNSEEKVAKVYKANTENTPPVITQINITPAQPGNEDSLSLNYTYSDADGDPEGDTLIHWYRNERYVPAYDSLTVIHSSYTIVEDVWYVVVTPHDGHGYGNPSAADSVTISKNGRNTPPVITELNITPAQPDNEDSLSLNYTYFDADGDPEGDTLIRWYRNGQYVPEYDGSTVIDSSQTSLGERWDVAVRPHDGHEYGNLSAAGPVTIVESNDPCNIHNLTINEVVADGKTGLWLVPTAGTALTVSYTDPCENDEGETLIRWARGGQFEMQEQPKFNEENSISGGITIPEERWCVTVTPHNGQEAGEPSQFCAYIENVPNLLPTVEVTIAEQPVSSDPLTMTYTYHDPDGGQENKELTQLRWYRNEVLQSEFNNKLVIPASNINARDNLLISENNINAEEEWCAVVQPHDGQGFGPISDPACTIISDPGQILPQINAKIGPEKPKDDDDLTIQTSPIGSDETRDKQTTDLICDEKRLHIRWFREGQIQPDLNFREGQIQLGLNFREGQIQPDLNNRCTVSSELTQPGEKWWATVQPYNEFGQGRAILTEPVYIVASETDPDNARPVITEAKITPAQPEDDDPLSLTYTYFDANDDPEGDTLIRWYKNLEHISLYDGLTIIPSPETSVGKEEEEVWHAMVIPNDGQQHGESVTTNSVAIGRPKMPGNTPPEVLIATLSPGVPGINEDLNLYYRYYDQDGDLERESQIRWKINGEERAAYDGRTRISGDLTGLNQTWCAIITPNDGQEDGEAKESNCVTIQPNGRNSAPEARDAHLVPANPTKDDNLELEYTYFDADGDPEVETTIFWYKVYQGKHFKRDFDNQTIVPASETARGEGWYAVIFVDDGIERNKKEFTTPLITINKPPTITEANLLPSPASSTQSLTVMYDYTDEDGDPDNSKIRWYQNGSHQQEHDGRRILPSQALTGGQRWYAVVTASDGYEDSDVITSTEVTIQCTQEALWCTHLPVVLHQPTPQPTATPVATPTPIPTPPPLPTPTIPIGVEPNNTQETAQGPLVPAEEYDAYPDDLDDWYYFVMRRNGLAKIEVTNYHGEGQVAVYREEFNPENGLPRKEVANDGRGGSFMEIPNEVDPHVFDNLPAGKYLVRVYTLHKDSNPPRYTLRVFYNPQ